MILKREIGTPVACVFMTDGATSHQGLIDVDELRHMRKREAQDATAILGLRPDDVHFLNFPDSQLARVRDQAITQVSGLLARYQPEEVYVPYRRDGTPDHEATFEIVSDSLRALGMRTTLLEYPVWFWNRWPWVPLGLGMSRATLTDLGAAVSSHCGLELIREFRSGMLVERVLEQKRAALDKHRSQMSSLRSDRMWPTLGHVSDGVFLECFFQPFEMFRASSHQ